MIGADLERKLPRRPALDHANSRTAAPDTANIAAGDRYVCAADARAEVEHGQAYRARNEKGGDSNLI